MANDTPPTPGEMQTVEKAEAHIADAVKKGATGNPLIGLLPAIAVWLSAR
jgi:hypothetical protein